MSKTVPGVVIHEDVLAFAREQGIEQYIEPLLESVLRHFPDAEPRLTMDDNPEDEDPRHIRIGIKNRMCEVNEFFAAKEAYKRDLFRIVPKRLTWLFRFGLERGDD